MRNITVSVDDDTYRRSRIRSAELETSVSALVRGFLERLVREPARASGERGVAAETGLERRRRLLEEIVADFDARGVGLRMPDNLPREELYDRGRARAEAAEAAGKHRGSPEPGGSGMKNITVSVDDDTYRHSRIRAAELKTSVSALVRGFLERLVQPGAEAAGADAPRAETEGERRRRLLDEVFEDICATRGGFRAADNVGREVLHHRDAIR